MCYRSNRKTTKTAGKPMTSRDPPFSLPHLMPPALGSQEGTKLPSFLHGCLGCKLQSSCQDAGTLPIEFTPQSSHVLSKLILLPWPTFITVFRHIQPMSPQVGHAGYSLPVKMGEEKPPWDLKPFSLSSSI